MSSSSGSTVVSTTPRSSRPASGPTSGSASPAATTARSAPRSRRSRTRRGPRSRTGPPDTGEIVESHADVAEIGYTAFAGSTHPVTARLIVRRARRLRPRQGQLELDTDLWDRLRRPSPGRRAEISGAVAGGVHVARRGVHRLAAALMPGAPTCPATANVVAVVECSGGGGGAGALVGGSGRAPRPLGGGGASRRP